jgi:hypothetical protein
MRGKYTGYWWKRMRETDHYEDQDIDGWIILTWIDITEIGQSSMGWTVLAQDGSVEGSCEHSNESLGSIKFWDVLEWLHK